jgi:hypothetical protein
MPRCQILTHFKVENLNKRSKVSQPGKLQFPLRSGTRPSDYQPLTAMERAHRPSSLSGVVGKLS